MLTVPHKEKVLRHVRATSTDLDAPKQPPAGQGITARNPVRRGWAHYSRYGAAQPVLPKVRQAPWQRLWTWAKRRHPPKRQAVGESALCSARRLVDMLGRKGGTGEARRHPDHPLHEGHREACPLGPSPAPRLDGAQEAAREKGNLRATTAEAAPETGIPMRAVSHPMHRGRQHRNGSSSPYKPRGNRRDQ